MNKILISFISAFVIVCLCGCGNPKVKGKVSFPDGSPLTQGTVCFESDNYVASGIIQPDGTYTLGGDKAGDGVPPGTYKVFITNAMTMDASNTRDASLSQAGTLAKLIKLIDAKYESPSTSGLTVNVEGAMTYDITVEKPK